MTDKQQKASDTERKVTEECNKGLHEWIIKRHGRCQPAQCLIYRKVEIVWIYTQSERLARAMDTLNQTEWTREINSDKD